MFVDHLHEYRWVLSGTTSLCYVPTASRKPPFTDSRSLETDFVETAIRSDNPYWSLVYGKGLEAADTDVFWTNFL